AATLSGLLTASVVQEQAPGRFAVHDLLRAYASGLGDLAERHRQARRLLDYYLQTARAAVRLACPEAQLVAVVPPGPGAQPEQFAGPAPALAWLQAEHHVLLAATGAAADSGFDVHAWQLAAVLREYLARRGHYADWARAQQIAVA